MYFFTILSNTPHNKWTTEYNDTNTFQQKLASKHSSGGDESEEDAFCTYVPFYIVFFYLKFLCTNENVSALYKLASFIFIHIDFDCFDQ